MLTGWCCIGRKLPKEYQEFIHEDIRNYRQSDRRTSTSPEKLNSRLVSESKTENNMRGCPSLVGGRPAKPVVSNGRVGSNPTPRANKPQGETMFFEEIS
jgi:hypothetical protein